MPYPFLGLLCRAQALFLQQLRAEPTQSTGPPSAVSAVPTGTPAAVSPPTGGQVVLLTSKSPSLVDFDGAFRTCRPPLISQCGLVGWCFKL